MTGKERISNLLRHRPADRIGLHEHFWNDTHSSYIAKGAMKEGESFERRFGLDISESWAFNLVADLDFQSKVVSEDEKTVTILDGNGAYLRRHKLHDTTPEHIKYTVTAREEWEEVRPLLLNADERRIHFDGYRAAKQAAERDGRFFVWSGVNVFEAIHPLIGHVNLLMGMALDPDWIRDMADTYANLMIALMEILFAKEGKPDGIWFYEDMGFKEKPFMSPEMYRELIAPYHKRTIDFAHSLGLPVIMHSCGFVEPLLPDMVAAGIDCLQAIEVKAGMDLLRIYRNFGEKIALMGGIDVRCLYSNDRAVIDRELEAKIPVVKQGFGYILHSDHSIPATVEPETLAYFIEKGLTLGQY